MKPKAKLNEASPRPVAEVLAEQNRPRPAPKAPPPIINAVAVREPASLPAAPDTRTAVQAYLDEVAPASIVGRMIKFSKDGKFITSDDAAEVSDETDFAALCDQTLIGWLKFSGQGEAPDRHMGLLYDGFRMPERGTLGNLDPAEWEIGLNGSPADPWQHHIYAVLQNVETKEMYTFVTSSQTGRRAIGNLLRHFDRVRKSDAGFTRWSV